MKYQIKLEHDQGWFWYIDGHITGLAMTKWGAKRAAEKWARRDANTGSNVIEYTYDTDGNHGDYYP